MFGNYIRSFYSDTTAAGLAPHRRIQRQPCVRSGWRDLDPAHLPVLAETSIRAHLETQLVRVEAEGLGLVVDEHARQGDPHRQVLSSGWRHRSRSGARGVVSRWWNV